jgi:ubiquinone/menaquinone biosynthesis C-methylase UbiE
MSSRSTKDGLYGNFVSQWDADPVKAHIAQTIAGNLEKAIMPFLKNKKTRMLDFGCGNGEITLCFPKYVKELVAVDPSEESIETFRKKLETVCKFDNVRTEALDILDESKAAVDFKANNRFDVIITSMTLHHVLDVPKAIKILYNMLEEGGILVVADLERNENSINFHPAGKKSHVHHIGGFTQEQIKQWLRETGFKDLHLSYFLIQKENASTHEMDRFPIFLIMGSK